MFLLYFWHIKKVIVSEKVKVLHKVYLLTRDGVLLIISLLKTVTSLTLFCNIEKTNWQLIISVIIYKKISNWRNNLDNQRQRALNSKMIKKIIDELDVIDELAKEIGYLRTIVKEQSEDIDKMKKEIRDLKFRC